MLGRINWKAWLFILVIAYGGYQHWHTRPVSQGPGVLAPHTPLQETPASSASIILSGYQIKPLADFTVEARVLATQQYRMGREAELSPLDLVLGWGPMSDEAVLKRINISQGDRFYFWHVDAFFIPRADIETHSANMHMIPADSSIETTLHSIRPGQIIQLRGQLVEVQAEDGWHWRSSLSRTDTGNGACELVLVKAIKLVK